MNEMLRKKIMEKENSKLLKGIMSKSTSHDIHNPRHAPLVLWGHTKEEKFRAYAFNGRFIEEKDALGFCYRHNLYLRINDAKRHKCLGKQCKYFAKNPNNEWWQARQNRNDAKKEAKRLQNERIEQLMEEASRINQQRILKAV